MEWICKTFEQLDLIELYDLLKLRVDVFVVEQNCPYPELDDKDHYPDVHHLLGYQDGKLVACSRLLPKGVSFDTLSIGRVVTHDCARGTGLGHELMKVSLDTSQKIWGKSDITISAQAHLEGYYQQHGFVKVSEEYLEDDIPHINMLRKC